MRAQPLALALLPFISYHSQRLTLGFFGSHFQAGETPRGDQPAARQAQSSE